MRQKGKLLKYLICLFMAVIVAPQLTYAASMTDYCASPPFIERAITPNLLLTIDNSASMWDLQYVDLGQKACSNGGACTKDSDCPAGGTCSIVTRNATYCYDETYSSTINYYGYFNLTDLSSGSRQYYQYDFSNNFFAPTTSFPADSATCGGHSIVRFRANTFCLDMDTSRIYRFVASGNFLNWLAASKFDVEKWILTGGKYGQLYGTTTNGLIAETRGCVGRRFLKQPLYTDFQAYTGTTDPNVTNKVDIIFGIRGPVNTSNPSAVSTGGQATIDIFYGNYNVANCQQVINDYLDPSTQKSDFITHIDNCISYSETNKNACEFLQSQICGSDADCGYFAAGLGACTVTANGLCGNFGGGVCATQTAGVCGTINGSCTGTNGVCVGGSKAGTPCTFGDNSPCKGQGTCSRVCVGGSNAGQACSSDSQCVSTIKQCTSGRVGNTCIQNSDCDTKWCTNTTSTVPEKFHSSCVANSDCNAGSCTAGKDSSAVCLQNSDCNTALGTCNAPQGAVGRACSMDSQCTVTGNGRCLPPASVQIKSTYDQSMHSCYQFSFKNQAPGIEEYQMVTNPAGCNQIYAQYRICAGGTNDGLRCNTLGASSECPSGTCIGGPSAIRPGSPVLLCGLTYAGFCAATTDNWATVDGVNWVAPTGSGYADAQSCVLAKFAEYCGAVTATPVTDPTNDPSNTLNYQNLPAIINDLGVTGQLGDPIESLPVAVTVASAPTGLIQDFSSVIRMGAMSFDFNGSATECGVRTTSGTISPSTVPAFCSNDSTRACTSDTGCGGTGICNPSVPCPYVCDSTSSNAGSPCSLLPGGVTLDCQGGACVLSAKDATNLDGAHILVNSYIGNTVSTSPNGGHTSAGLINDIDSLQANAWTPFSEGLYNAIGYYALTSTTAAPLRLNLNDFNMTPVPSQFRCQKNNVLLITDGQSTADLNSTVSTLISSNAGLLPAGAHYDTTANNSCVPYAGGRNMEALSWLAQHRNIQNISGQTPQSNSQRISSYVVYTGTGSMDDATCASQTDGQLAALADCQPDNLMCKTARYGNDKPNTYYLAQDPETLRAKLKSALVDIATSAASGTAASVLASGEGSGANLVQAIFYPARKGSGYEVDWTGRLQNFWYYIDPRLGNSTILEDTDLDKALKLSQDSAVGFVYDPTTHQTTVTTTSPGGVVTPNVSLENVHYLWEAGKLLLSRTAGSLNGPTDGAGARVIYTNTNPTRGSCSVSGSNCSATSDCPVTGGVQESCILTNHSLDAFDTSNAANLSPLLNVNTNGLDTSPNYDQTKNLIKYIRGIDDLDANGQPSQGTGLSSPVYTTSSGDTIDSVRARNRTLTQGSVTNTWKLGDIVNSTPKILSWVPLNTYYDIYNDSTYKSFTSTTSYKSRGLVFTGGNDGMMHAFKLGLLGLYDDVDLKATLGAHCSATTSQACDCIGGTYPCSSGMTPSCPSGEPCVIDSDLGQEMWSFIPKNSLPYLKYFADPNYCHIYYIDAQPFIFDGSFAIDASANPAPATPPPPADACDTAHYWNCMRSANSWKTVLIGSMRLGGACKNAGNTCQDCTKAPMNNVGYSSYFALDVTDPLNPQLLWEFSDPRLGFSTSGPAIVKVVNSNLANKRERNGRWLAVFGSGPTGWISQNNNMAISSMYLSNVGLWNSQPNSMKLFVVDVATGNLVTTIETGEQGAFTGSLLNATMDFDQGDLSRDGNYQDDAVYFGFTKGYVYAVDSGITQGNALGGSANTMKLAAGSSTTNDFYKGNFIEMWQQDATLQWHYEGVKLITGYDGATQTVTVDSNFPVVPTSGSPWSFYFISKGWTRGGVKRLLTNQDVDPTHWAVSTVIDSNSLSGNSGYNSAVGSAGMGPVTASVKKLQNYSNNSVRLYFGSGRYYYRMADLLDDPSNLRALYSVMEPCVQANGTVDPVCTTRTSGNIAGGAPAISNIAEAATAAGISASDPSLKGWWITLDGCRDSNLASVSCLTASGVANPSAVFKAERVVTEPLAASSGAIFFSTITPTADPCEYGGRSYLWAVRFDTGGTLVNTGVLKGKAIIQRSTGDIEQIDLATAFTTAGGGQAGERKTQASFGLTGSGGISIVVPPKPLNQILHIKKR